MPITFVETDEVNNPTATYVYSEVPSTGTGRLDVVDRSPSTEWSFTAIRSWLVDIFLPAGFPHSVSDDYLPYQIFDSLQAFCSSIAGLLSSRAVLQGVGVGDAAASPTAALLLHILQDSSGRIVTVIFAHRIGPALEPECKMYRFAADIFNDLAMILDCLSPGVPAGIARVVVLSIAGVLRALCGVAGGSSKASLSAHFAKSGNIAEVNAKDSSQETIISLLGMVVGSYVVSEIITGLFETWATLLALLAFHLSLNYAAVRAVQMTSLNRQRANIVFASLFESDQALESIHGSQTLSRRKGELAVLTPAEVSKREKIFTQDGALAWVYSPTLLPLSSSVSIGFCRIGVDLFSFLQGIGPPSKSKSKVRILHHSSTDAGLAALTSIFSNERYMLLFNYTQHWEGRILLKPSCTAESQLKAWAHALLAARVLSYSMKTDRDRDSAKNGNIDDRVLSVISRTLAFLNEGGRFAAYLKALRKKGWQLETGALETRSSGRRVSSSCWV